MFGRKDLSSLLFSKLKFVKVESKLTSYKGILNIAHYTCNIHFVFVESLTSVLLIMHVAAGVVKVFK